jgi:hypothetical protein
MFMVPIAYVFQGLVHFIGTTVTAFVVAWQLERLSIMWQPIPQLATAPHPIHSVNHHLKFDDRTVCSENIVAIVGF